MCIHQSMATTYFTNPPQETCYLGVYQEQELVDLKPLGIYLAGKSVTCSSEQDFMSSIDKIVFSGQSYLLRYEDGTTTTVFMVHTEQQNADPGEDTKVDKYFLGIDPQSKKPYVVSYENISPLNLQRIPGAEAGAEFINDQMGKIASQSIEEHKAAQNPVAVMTMARNMANRLAVEVISVLDEFSYITSDNVLIQFPDGSLMEASANGCRCLSAREHEIERLKNREATEIGLSH